MLHQLYQVYDIAVKLKQDLLLHIHSDSYLAVDIIISSKLSVKGYHASTICNKVACNIQSVLVIE